MNIKQSSNNDLNQMFKYAENFSTCTLLFKTVVLSILGKYTIFYSTYDYFLFATSLQQLDVENNFDAGVCEK